MHVYVDILEQSHAPVHDVRVRIRGRVRVRSGKG